MPVNLSSNFNTDLCFIDKLINFICSSVYKQPVHGSDVFLFFSFENSIALNYSHSKPQNTPHKSAHCGSLAHQMFCWNIGCCNIQLQQLLERRFPNDKGINFQRKIHVLTILLCGRRGSFTYTRFESDLRDRSQCSVNKQRVTLYTKQYILPCILCRRSLQPVSFENFSASYRKVFLSACNRIE